MNSLNKDILWLNLTVCELLPQKLVLKGKPHTVKRYLQRIFLTDYIKESNKAIKMTLATDILHRKIRNKKSETMLILFIKQKPMRKF